jgi:hypothetical protein
MLTQQQRRTLNAINRDMDALIYSLEAKRADLAARQRRTATRLAVLGLVALGSFIASCLVAAFWVQHIG